MGIGKVEEDRAFAEGYRDARLGYPKSLNPYSGKHTEKETWWGLGWFEGDRDNEKKPQIPPSS